jgi:hypothetical protein
MRTIEIQAYQFRELSEEAKQYAINKYRDNNIDFSFMYEEAHESVKKFNEIFDTEEGRNSWLDVRTSMINDNILLLTGTRLQTYIWNNYGKKLFKRKYLGGAKLTETPKKYHRMRNQSQITANCGNKGLWRASYYSNIQLDNCCVLTGVCYEDSLLKPIYDFLNTPQKDNSVSFEDLIEDCFRNLKKDIEAEEEAMNTDEYIAEEIENDEIEFNEAGEII